MTTRYNFKSRADELQLADVLDIGSLGTDEWHTAIVKNIKDDHITLYRPYGHHADFSYTGGVICYVGIEEYNIPRNERMFHVFRRTELR